MQILTIIFKDHANLCVFLLGSLWDFLGSLLGSLLVFRGKILFPKICSNSRPMPCPNVLWVVRCSARRDTHEVTHGIARVFVCSRDSNCFYTYVTSHICDISICDIIHMCHHTYGTSHMCDITHNHTHMTSYICNITHMWHHTYVTARFRWSPSGGTSCCRISTCKLLCVLYRSENIMSRPQMRRVVPISNYLVSI